MEKEINDIHKNENDFCECGGILNYIERDKDDVMTFKCEKCGQIYYNERDL